MAQKLDQGDVEMGNKLRAILLAGTFIYVMPPAYAQDVSAANSQEAPARAASGDPNSDSAVGEIVVTAQRREQKLNDVGMSITATSGDALINRNVTEIAGLTRIEPSLQYSQSNAGTPVYTIRGVGYFEQSLNATPAVSVYLDEVGYTVPLLSKGALLDVQRVEILKGPQGTLYGQNATGGAVNFVANRPTPELAAGVNATYARFGAVQLDGFISGPLTETLGARLAARVESGGAWQDSVTRDDRLGDRDFATARLLLDWNPTDALKVSLNLNGFSDKSEKQAPQLIGFRIVSPQFVQPLAPGALNDPATYLPDAQKFPAYPKGIQDILSNPIAPRNNRAADWATGTRPRGDEKFYQATLRLDYSFSDALNLTSISNYEKFDESNYLDISGIAQQSVGIFIDGRVETVFQEVRLHGELFDNKLNWLLGGSFQKDKIRERDSYPTLTSSSYLTGGSPFSPLPIGPYRQFAAFSDVKVRTAAVFSNLEYNFSPRLSVHGGIRYTSVKNDIAGCSTSSDPGLAIILATPPGECATLLPDGTRGLYQTKLDEDNISWRVGVDYKPTPGSLIYVSASKGYKAGGSPALGATVYQQYTPVTQESIMAYEAGFKLSLLNRAVQLNGAFFHYDYSDKQILGRFIDDVVGNIIGLVNIPKSKVSGFELSTIARPTKGLTLTGAVTYLDSKVTQSFLNFSPYIVTDGVTPPFGLIDFKGEPFPFTPKWSLNYGARYEFELNSRLNAFASIDGRYQSKSVAAFGAEQARQTGPSFDISGYAVVDATIGVESNDKKWRASLWAKNVFNKYYWNSVLYFGDTVSRITGQPSTYGMSLSWNY